MRTKKPEDENKLKKAGKYGLAAAGGIGVSKLSNSNTANYVRSGIQNRIGNSGLAQSIKQDYNSVVRPAKEGLMRNKTISSAVNAVTSKKGLIRGGLRKLKAKGIKTARKSKFGRNVLANNLRGTKALAPYKGIINAGLGGIAAYGAYRWLKNRKKKQED